MIYVAAVMRSHDKSDDNWTASATSTVSPNSNYIQEKFPFVLLLYVFDSLERENLC